MPFKDVWNRPLPLPHVNRSFQDMSTNTKTSSRFGLLTPTYVEEIVPADRTIEFSPVAYMRLSPLMYPIMHNINCRMHTFEVPYRVVVGDENYRSWINNEIEWPTVFVTLDKDTYDEIMAGTRFDIFTSLGYVPETWVDSGVTYYAYVLDNGLDYLSICRIWADWYADSQLDEAAIISIEGLLETYQRNLRNGATTFNVNYYNLAYREFECRMGQDYFTAARPQPELGSPVNLTGSPTMWIASGSTRKGYIYSDDSNNGATSLNDGNGGHPGGPLTIDLTIRELWRREQIQRFFDVTNTFGTRIREFLAGHFGIIYPDDRLQISRLLQTESRTVSIQEVIQTTPTASSPLGAYAGKGTVYMKGKHMRHTFLEHGFLITLCSIVPENGYTSTRPRYQFKKNVFDCALPEFNNIGYQEIYKGEVNKLIDHRNGQRDAWAYVPRFSEYRTHPSRSFNAMNLNPFISMHLNRYWTQTPGLNPAFISGYQSDFDRIFTDSEAQEDMTAFLIDCTVIHKMYRPVSYLPSSMHL